MWMETLLWKQWICYSFPRFENCKSRVWKNRNAEKRTSGSVSQDVALQFLWRPREPEIPDSLVAKHIAHDSNVERYESVENVTLYTLKECAGTVSSKVKTMLALRNFALMRQCRHLWTFCLLMRSNEISFVQKLSDRRIVSTGLIKDLEE